jgi:4-carboxymuconolactone decarboxylase
MAVTSTPDTTSVWPDDIHPESGSRVTVPDREHLDPEGQAIYDATLASANAPYRGGIPGGGLTGPAGIQLHSPLYRKHFQAMNDYLRFGAGIPPRMREIAILCTARETDHQYEWCGHEPMALRVGLDPELIDIIRYDAPLDGIDEEDAVVIALVREAIGGRKVSSETYARASELLGSQMLVNLSGLIGHYLSVGVLLRIFDRQLKNGWTPRLPLRDRIGS